MKKRIHKITRFIFWATLFFCAVSAFKASTDPLPGFLKDTILQHWLAPYPLANSVIFNLSIGYIVSSFFYFLVVFLPEKRKSNFLRPYIVEKVEGIIFSSSSTIREILRKANSVHEFSTLTLPELTVACKNLDPKAHMQMFHNGAANTFQAHLGYKLYNDWQRVMKKSSELFKVLTYVDAELLSLLTRYENLILNHTVDILRDYHLFSNTNIETFSDSYYELYLLTRELRAYGLSYKGGPLVNDPWQA